MSKKPKVTQEEYNKAIKTIEDNSCYKFTAGDNCSGAFFIAVTLEGRPYPESTFYLRWDEIEELAKVVKNKPISMCG